MHIIHPYQTLTCLIIKSIVRRSNTDQNNTSYGLYSKAIMCLRLQSKEVRLCYKQKANVQWVIFHYSGYYISWFFIQGHGLINTASGTQCYGANILPVHQHVGDRVILEGWMHTICIPCNDNTVWLRLSNKAVTKLQKSMHFSVLSLEKPLCMHALSVGFPTTKLYLVVCAPA